MKQHKIHSFLNKLLQKSVFPHLKKYLDWQAGKDRLDYKQGAYSFAPVCINLDLTTACNFNCPYCIDKQVLNTGKMLDFDYLKGLVGHWAENGLKSVIIIGGGEPTIYPFFEKVVEFLKSKNLQVAIVTNGTRMDKIEKIAHLFEPKDWIRLSIDAGTDKTFQEFHCPRIAITLEGILNKVSEVKKKNPGLQIGFSFLILTNNRCGGITLGNNVSEIALAAQKAKEYGFSYFSLKPFIDFDRGRKTNMADNYREQIKQEIKKAKVLEDENFRIFESKNLLDLLAAKDLEKQEKPYRYCHYQFFRLAVMPDGIFMCPLWRGVTLPEAKLIDTNQEVNEAYLRKLQENRARLIREFNAQEICADCFCFSHEANLALDDLVKNPEKLKELKPIEDFNDYFL